MFEEATRKKFRFPYYGTADVEDLWDLSVEDLDEIFKTLNSQRKTINEESLLEVKTEEDRELNTKIEIIKHIVGIKIEERDFALQAKERAEKKQRLLEILKDKQDASLLEKSEEELQAMLDEL